MKQIKEISNFFGAGADYVLHDHRSLLFDNSTLTMIYIKSISKG